MTSLLRPWFLILSLGLASGAGAQNVTVDATNSPYVISSASSFAQLTVAAGGVLMANSPVTVSGDLSVLAGGLVTVNPAVSNTVRLTVAGALTVNVGGAIDLTGKGLAALTTISPGTGAVIPYAGCDRCGGSHFTRGTGISMGAGPPPFDEPTNPQYPGGGGVDGRGGGAVLATAATIQVDGRVSVDGENRLGTGVSGAGGSINLTTSQFSGFGVLSAQGGATQVFQGINPAGGLILVTTPTSTFTGSFLVTGGTGVAGVGPGTALWLTPARAATLLAGTYSLRFADTFASFTVRAATTLSVDGRASVTAPMSVGSGATVILNSPASLEAVTIDQVDGTLKIMADVTTASPLHLRGQLVVDHQFTVASLDAASGAVISHSPQVTTMHLIATGALTLATGSLVNAQGAGLPGGTTIDPITFGVVSGAGPVNGGSHAGLGGKASAGAQPPTYDDPNAPRFGGGGGGGNVHAGPPGGGVIRLSASLMQVDGALLADGTTTPGQVYGSGAGGSIVLTAGTLRGNGWILARGYSGADSVQGGGGGGIINISCETSTFTGTKSVIGGQGDKPGGDGVIVEKKLTSAPVIVSAPPSAVTRVGQAFTYTPVATGAKPLNWSLPTAPTGATVDPATGAVNWVPQAEGVAAFDLAVANASDTAHQAFAVTAMQPPAVTSTASSAATVGQPYHYDADDTLAASGSPPLTWTLLVGPAGMAVEAGTGRVTWVPQAGGTQLVCVEVTNDVGKARQCFAVAVTGGPTSTSDGGVDAPRFTSTPGTAAICGAPYRYAPSRVPTVEGTGPFEFALAPALGVALPPALAVDPRTGELSWTPTSEEAGAHPLELRVSGPGGSAAQQFAIIVECPEAQKTTVQCGCSTPGSSLLLSLVALAWGRRRGTRHVPRAMA